MTRLSQLPEEDIPSLSVAQKTELVYTYPADDGRPADLALLLGSYPSLAADRAETAADLWAAGRFRHIVPTGGVTWPKGDPAGQSECDFMTSILLSRGVPASAIIPENEARTTRENMICSALQVERTVRWANVHSVLIVSSPAHLRRSLALGKFYLPRGVADRLSVCPSGGAFAGRNEWSRSPEMVAIVENEIRFLRRLILQGVTPDIAFS